MSDYYQLPKKLSEWSPKLKSLDINKNDFFESSEAKYFMSDPVAKQILFGKLIKDFSDKDSISEYFPSLFELYNIIYKVLWGNKEEVADFLNNNERDFIEREIFELSFLLTVGGGLDRKELVVITRWLFLEDLKWEIVKDQFFQSLCCYLKTRKIGKQKIVSFVSKELEFFGIPFLSIGSETIKVTMKSFFGINPSISKLFDTLDLLSHLKDNSEFLIEFLEDLTLDDFISNCSSCATYEEMHEICALLITRVAEKIRNDLKGEKILVSKVEGIIKPLMKKYGASTLPIAYYPFLHQIMDVLNPNTVRMEEIMDLEPNIAKRFVAKKAYSVKKDKIQIKFPGGSGIGHSGIIIKVNNRTILLDFGLSVVNHQTPHWDIALEAIDSILISHAHLDHIGGLSLLYGLGLKEPWFGVSPTNHLTEILLKNNSALFKEKVASMNSLPNMKLITSPSNIAETLDNFIPLGYKRKKEISPGVFVTAFPACHIFGSAGFLIEINGKTILYTGDFNLNKTQLFPGADFPTDIDCLIFDGTYFDAKPFNPQVTDDQLRKAVLDYDRTIIPAFTIGRAQEVLVRLDKLGLLKDRTACLVGMASRIAGIANIKSPYSSGHISYDKFEEGMILIAGGGMLSGGVARVFLDESRDDPRTSIVFCGYQAPGTLGQCLRDGHPLTNIYHQPIFNARMSAHSSSDKLHSWLKTVSAKKKILVHYPGSKCEEKDLGIEVPIDLKYKIEL